MLVVGAGATGTSSHHRTRSRALREAACAAGTVPQPEVTSLADHAPCGLRPCNVYTAAGYSLTRYEGVCYGTSQLPGDAPAVPLTLFFNNAQDNMGAQAPPADGQVRACVHVLAGWVGRFGL